MGYRGTGFIQRLNAETAALLSAIHSAFYRASTETKDFV
ncbi:MAG: hypothetical protein OFPII_30610 [Osedax symbiont Rs1]|nr:MAG: hypothetical protein OFPII_30610 [Osedax symbiont Rs1]